MGRVLSVNVSTGEKVEFNGRVVGTGIFKKPVEGAVTVDTRVHGGEHKAVYAYPYEHYATWMAEEERDDFAPGQFGENLTTEGWLETDVHVGDRFRVGTALLEVTQPREPCFKLGIRMGDAAFPRKLVKAMRSGFYFRVIEEGAIAAGDAMNREHADPAAVSVHDLYRLRFRDFEDRAAIKRALDIPALSKEWRRILNGL